MDLIIKTMFSRTDNHVTQCKYARYVSMAVMSSMDYLGLKGYHK